MSVVDLKYAREAQPEGEKAPVVFAVHCQGWNYFWATFAQDQPAGAGSFLVPDHVDGHALPHARQCVMAFATLADLMGRYHVTLVVTDEADRKAPSATLLPVMALVMRAEFVVTDKGWLDDLGMKRKELVSWATVSLGKPAKEGAALALAMGSWVTRSRRRGAGRI